MTTDTIISDALRLEHAQNQSVGAGNFLHAAARLSPFAHEQHFWTDRPTQIFTGEIFKGFSLNELKHVVDTYASWYYGAGIRAKDPVAVYVGEGIENLIHYLALNAIGAIPAIVNGNMPPEIAAKWMEKVGAVALYSDAAHSQAIAPYLLNHSGFRFFVTDETAHALYLPKLPPVYPFVHSEKDTVLIGHSSGTTGIPKAVEFQHQQFFYGIRFRLGLPFSKGSEKMLSALPHSHSAGLAYVMLAVLNGCSTLILSSNQPDTVLPGIESFKPSMVVAFPETYVLLHERDLSTYDLSSVQLWFNGGDAAHEPHIKTLIQHGHHFAQGKKAPGSVFIDGLGSSEMGFSLFRNVHTLQTTHYNRCIGTPLEWVDAMVLGENGEKLPPYQVGRLGVKAPSITPGYWNDSLLTARSQLSGYFLTGDLFYRDELGKFYHVDRVPDRIQTEAGTVYSLETEEILLKNFKEIIDCTVVAATSTDQSRIAAAVVRLKKGSEREDDVLLTRFNEKLKEAGKNTLGLVRNVHLKDIPLGSTGKVLKRELREQLQRPKEMLHA